MGIRQPSETPENEAFKTTFPARFCPAIRLRVRDRVNDRTVNRILKRFLDFERARSATRFRIAGHLAFTRI